MSEKSVKKNLFLYVKIARIDSTSQIDDGGFMT